MLVHAFRALVAMPTPLGRHRNVWGEARAGTSRRVGSPRRRASIAEALRILVVWCAYQCIRPALTHPLTWMIPFVSTIQWVWLLWMLLQPPIASYAVFASVLPWIRRYEASIDNACLWGLGAWLFITSHARRPFPRQTDADEAHEVDMSLLVQSQGPESESESESEPELEPEPAPEPAPAPEPEPEPEPNLGLAHDTPTLFTPTLTSAQEPTYIPKAPAARAETSEAVLTQGEMVANEDVKEAPVQPETALLAQTESVQKEVVQVETLAKTAKEAAEAKSTTKESAIKKATRANTIKAEPQKSPLSLVPPHVESHLAAKLESSEISTKSRTRKRAAPPDSFARGPTHPPRTRSSQPTRIPSLTRKRASTPEHPDSPPKRRRAAPVTRSQTSLVRRPAHPPDTSPGIRTRAQRARAQAR